MAAVAKRLILLILVISIVEARVLELYSSDDELISDGIEKQELGVKANTDICRSACEQQYGFLPCAENTAGYLFLIVVYQVLLVVGGRLIGSGCEVLFRITGTGAGNLGGIIFRILTALPSSILMILSGIFSSKEGAQSQVSVGVGIYAGITVFSLTIQWGICIIYGMTDLADEPSRILDSNTSSKEKKNDLERFWHLTIIYGHSQLLAANISFFFLVCADTGVKIDKGTCYTAGVMLLSLIPYVVLQLVYVLDTLSEKRIVTLIALIVSSLSLLSYFTYQIWSPWMQERSLSYSDRITEEEFIEGIEKWIAEAMGSASDTNDMISTKDAGQQVLSKLSGCTFEGRDTNSPIESKDRTQYRKRDLLRSGFQVLLGIAILTFLGKPLTANILQLSNAIGFPSFIISFVVVPLAMNARSAIAAILPACKKSEETASWTFSPRYTVE